MIKRIALLAAFATAVLAAGDARAQNPASGFSSFSTIGSSTTQYVRGSEPSGLDATFSTSATGAFTLGPLSFLQPSVTPPAFGAYIPAVLTLTATSSNAVTTMMGENNQDGFDGFFTITSGSDLLLRGDFSNATLIQEDEDTLLFSASNIAYTSDIFKDLFQTSFGFTVSGGFGNLGVDGDAFEAFNSSTTTTSGTFSAAVVPEPATLAMAGLGVIGLPIALRIVRRRRSS